MKRIFVLALGLLFVPAMASAQVEAGLDAFFTISNPSEPEGSTGSFDNTNSFELPAPVARVGFPAGETILVETILGFNWASQGDESETALVLLPGVNFLLGEQFYVRGEAGLLRMSYDDGTDSESTTQYGFGGAAGMRMPLGDAAIFRIEAGVDRWLEAKDGDVITALGRTDIRIGAGISAIVN